VRGHYSYNSKWIHIWNPVCINITVKFLDFSFSTSDTGDTTFLNGRANSWTNKWKYKCPHSERHNYTINEVYVWFTSTLNKIIFEQNLKKQQHLLRGGEKQFKKLNKATLWFSVTAIPLSDLYIFFQFPLCLSEYE
jgi:hypothetical protein